MIREELESSAAYADVTVHGSGLTGLQYSRPPACGNIGNPVNVGLGGVPA